MMTLKTAALLLCAIGCATAQEKLGPVTPPKGQPITDFPILGMGTVGLNSNAQAISVITSALQNGIRNFDTAAAYKNEARVGVGIAEALKKTGLSRDDVWITTKVWNDMHGNKVQQSLQESLKRLNMSRVDLFLMHFPFALNTPDGQPKFDYLETWKEMEKLVRPGGPVRYIGVSNFDPGQMTKLLAAATIKPKVHQFELHPYLQQPEFVAWHHQNGVAMTAYAPLANTSPFYAMGVNGNPNRPPKLLRNTVMTEIARDRGCSAAQVALAWNMMRNVSVIPKAAQDGHQKENASALDKCKLTDGDMKKIEAMPAKWSERVNNPCKKHNMPCFAGLSNQFQGVTW